MPPRFWLLGPVTVFMAACAAPGDDAGGRLVRVDHYVRVQSTAPSMAGHEVQLYVREVALPGTAAGGAASAPVVLFVHGAGTPAVVAFDAPYKDYSWMAYLAHAGFDVFSMDQTGYGRSTRPPPMNDPCNFPKDQQAQFVPKNIPAPCGASFPTAMTTMGSDWEDIGAVVDHLRALRRVDQVSLVGWSQGGPRAGAMRRAIRRWVARLVVLAPARGRSTRPAHCRPAPGR